MYYRYAFGTKILSNFRNAFIMVTLSLTVSVDWFETRTLYIHVHFVPDEGNKGYVYRVSLINHCQELHSSLHCEYHLNSFSWYDGNAYEIRSKLLIIYELVFENFFQNLRFIIIYIIMFYFDSCASPLICYPNAVTSATWLGYCAARAIGHYRPSTATVPRVPLPIYSNVRCTKPRTSKSATSIHSHVLRRA